MIAFVKGILEEASAESVVIESGGLGYRIAVSSATAQALPSIGSPVKLYTYLNVTETGVALFGFAAKEEQEMFQRLITVSGIGPKGALGFLSALSPSELILAVLSDDLKTLCKAPGIGKKTAQRMVLELRDKFHNEDFLLGSRALPAAVEFVQGDPKTEAVEALAQLGYTRSEAVRAVSGVDGEGLSTEAILKQALKSMLK